jgi:hypothetical protein
MSESHDYHVKDFVHGDPRLTAPLLDLSNLGCHICHLKSITALRVSVKNVKFSKGQLISKCLLGVLNFFQETKENKSTNKLKKCLLEKIISRLSDL